MQKHRRLEVAEVRNKVQDGEQKSGGRAIRPVSPNIRRDPMGFPDEDEKESDKESDGG